MHYPCGSVLGFLDRVGAGAVGTWGGDACVAPAGKTHFRKATYHIHPLSPNWPSPMLYDPPHQLNRLPKCRYNSLIMLDILKQQHSPLTILQPLLIHLVTTNMKIPHAWSNIPYKSCPMK